MNLGGYNGRPGDGFITLIYFLYLIAGPYLLIFLEGRAFRKAEAQSIPALIILILLGLPACYYVREIMTEINRGIGLFKFQCVVLAIGTIGFPIALGWEAYKRGWISRLMEKRSKSKKKQKKIKVAKPQ
jgi:hypothetical protein